MIMIFDDGGITET